MQLGVELPAPPEGRGLTVMHLDDGVEITVRHANSWRWLLVAFLGACSIGWGWVGIVVLGNLLASLARTFGWNLLPPGLQLYGELGPVAAVVAQVLALAALGLGGGLSLASALRLGWGRDTFTQRGEEWTLSQSVGPFHRTRLLSAGAMRNVETDREPWWSRAPQHMQVEAVGKSVLFLTYLGSPAEQEWLARVVGRISRQVAPPPCLEPETAWNLQSLPDGAIRITRRRTGAVEKHPSGMRRSVSRLLGAEEWRADRDRLLLIRSRFGREQVESFTGGTLSIEIVRRCGGDLRKLVLRAEGRQTTLRSVRTFVGTNELREVAVLLSHRTGWPLIIPPEVGR